MRALASSNKHVPWQTEQHGMRFTETIEPYTEVYRGYPRQLIIPNDSLRHEKVETITRAVETELGILPGAGAQIKN